MGTVTQTRQQHEPLRQLTAREPRMTTRGDTDEIIMRRETTTVERRHVCGYRAEQRDGLLIHEAAALFSVSFFGCDNPNNYPPTHDSEPAAVG
jgi:hypothetical protein